MKEIRSLGEGITREDYGTKAYWINWMYEQGICVPKSLFIPVMEKQRFFSAKEQERFRSLLWDRLQRLWTKEGQYAVRTSALEEDGARESNTGKFTTYLNRVGWEKTYEGILQIWREPEKDSLPGIIVQDMVSSSYAGVVFSSEPWNGRKTEIFISVTKGTGERLLAGLEAGWDIVAREIDGVISLQPYELDIPQSVLLEICQMAKRIEQRLHFPVDLEWCMERETNKIFWLQCRPITSILLREDSTVLRVEDDTVKEFPQYLWPQNIAGLKKMALGNKVLMPDIYLVLCNCVSEKFPQIHTDFIRSEYYSGYSAVLVSPSMKGLKKAYLIGDKKSVYTSTQCHRFGVRDIADYQSLASCLEELYKLAEPLQWTCSFLIREIWRTKYSGIMQQTNEGYVIELAKGNFQTKGRFPVNTYVVDSDGKVRYRKESKQEHYMDIVEGCILEHCENEEETLCFSDEYIHFLVSCFKDVINATDGIIEFGILDDERITPYLIGVVEEKQKENVSLSAIERGVISEGKITGRLIKLDIIENYTEIISEIKGPVIFYAETPYIQLQDLLKLSDSRQIGFVFSKGALLCHLAILLREKGIPAVCGFEENQLEEGEIYQLNTYSEQIILRENLESLCEILEGET